MTLISNKKSLFNLTSFFIIILIITGCATHDPLMIDDPPGFFSGLFHGFIILFSFIIGLFTDYTIYAYPNTGGWYDFGFLIGVMIFFGGGGSSARRKK